MSPAPGQPLAFGPYRLDPATPQLWRGEQAVVLQAKPLAVLCYLAARPGQVVSKRELLKAVWAGTYVTPAVLKVCVRAIREALEDDAAAPRYIETVGREGYRFRDEGTGEESSPEAETREPGQRWMVGRTRELTQLHHWLTTAARGTRQLIFVTGEPGIGKTTLVEQFLARVSTHSEVWIGRGQCIEQHGPGEAYLPVLEAIGRWCRAPGGARVVERLRQYAPSWLVQLPAIVAEEERRALVAHVQGATHERMLREMAEALEALTAERVVILALEDLQWSDHSTLELLAYLAQRRERARLLVLGTYRPADLVLSGHALKGLKQELQAHGQCEELRLELFTEAEVIEYIAGRFAAAAFSPAVGRLIHRHTEGNALFVVNAVDELVQQGLIIEKEGGRWALTGDGTHLHLPDTLRQLIAKQVGQLRDEEQRVLEVASVTGSEFVVAAVAAALQQAPEAVEDLCEALAWQGHFLREQGIAEWPDGTVSGRYEFRHTLYPQVLYERIAAARRVRLHRVMGERIEQGYGGRASEVAAELVVHFERGRDYARAVRYRQHAGKNALRRGALPEAIAHFRAGLELLTALPATPERRQQELTLQLALGPPLSATQGWAAPDTGRAYARARALCQQTEDTAELFPTLFGLWVFHYTRAELATARELAEQLLHRAQRDQDPALLMEAHHALGNTLHRLGELTAARAHLEQSLTLYDAQQHHALAMQYGLDDGVAGLGYSTWVLWSMGYVDQALHKSQELLQLAQGLAHPLGRAWAYNSVAWHYQFRREAQHAKAWAEAGIALCAEQGFAQLRAVGAIVQGWALAAQGQVEAGIGRMREGLTALQDTGTAIGYPRYLGLLAEAYGAVQQAEVGLSLLGEALTVLKQTGEGFYAAELSRLQGTLMLLTQASPARVRSPSASLPGKAAGRRAQAGAITAQPSAVTPQAEAAAEACFQQAIAIARQQGAKTLELRAAVSLSRLWQQQGKRADAHQLLAEVYAWFTEGFDTPDLQEAHVLLKELS